MKNKILPAFKFHFLLLLILCSVLKSQVQKKSTIQKKTAEVVNNMLSTDEMRILNLINEMRNDPKSFAEANNDFLFSNYPEFYSRLNSSSKLEPLTLECNFVNAARAGLNKDKFSPCNLPGGHTLAPILIDESKGDYSSYSDMQLICSVNFNLLEPDPNYTGICLVKNKGIVIAMGNYQGEEHTYHAEIKEYKATLAKKNIYLFQHMEPAIDRNLLALINAERKNKNLAPLKFAHLSKSTSVAGQYNSLYYNESIYGLKVTDTAGTMKSKSEKFANEHKDFIVKGFYKKLTVLEHIVDTVTLAKELFSLFMASEKNSAFLRNEKQTEIGLNVNSSGSNFCLFATIAFYKDPGSAAEEKKAPLGQVEPQGTDMYKINMEVLRLVNELRKSKGLEPVSTSGVTESAAFYHTKYMSSSGHFSHTGRDKGYEEFWNRLDNFKGDGQLGAGVENIAWFSVGYFTDKSIKEIAMDVFTVWKESPGHYRNMLHATTNFASVSGMSGANGHYFTYVGTVKK